MNLAGATEDIVMRLETIIRDFPAAVDLGARNGAFARALAESDAASRVGLLVETDISQGMLAGRAGVRLASGRRRRALALLRRLAA